MSAHEVMQEVKDLIAFYEASGWDWLLAAEFTLRKHFGSWPERWDRRWPKRPSPSAGGEA